MNKAFMVGYLESWSPADITFTQAASKGYDMLIMAFASISKTKVDIVDGTFAPSPTSSALKADISEAKSMGAEHVLFSVGGANNTYQPDGVAVDELATNIVAFAEQYGFTGIDFDLEIDTDGQYLDNLCAAIKKQAPNLLITAAPQVNQNVHNQELMLVSTQAFRVYDIAVANERFDYLFIQAYNNEWPMVEDCKEDQVGFISAAFKNLIAQVPDKTMITIGEPANIDASESINIYKGPDMGDNIYSLVAEQYQMIKDDAQFGGAMVWDVNWDAKTDYQFVNAVKDAIT